MTDTAATSPRTPSRAPSAEVGPPTRAPGSGPPRRSPSSWAASSASGSSTSRPRWPATGRSRWSRWVSRPSGRSCWPCCSRRCSRRLPADGGPYAYARVAFGNKVGFVNAWSYWITAWAGNAAIAVGWVLYVEQFVNKGHNRARVDPARAGRLVDPGGDQPLGREEHGIGPGGHDDPQVRRPRLHVDRRASSTSRAPTTRRGT